MAYKQLTEGGKAYIRKICAGSGNSLLSGRSKQRTPDNLQGVLPLFYPTPEIGSVVTWTSQAKYNGKSITTNQQLGEALIDWYDKYGKLFEMDANFLAAQAFQESGYNVWIYALTSTASGISQFVIEALYEFVINSPNRINVHAPILMTPAEVAAITVNITGDKKDINTYLVKTSLGRQNRPILHQNVIDNPEIMIKAQYRYMKYIASKYGALASNALFGYNRGPGFIRDNYTDTINAAKTYKNGYENEGVDYVYKIFRLLDFEFGYKQLGMTLPPSQFNSFDADVANTNKKG